MKTILAISCVLVLTCSATACPLTAAYSPAVVYTQAAVGYASDPCVCNQGPAITPVQPAFLPSYGYAPAATPYAYGGMGAFGVRAVGFNAGYGYGGFGAFGVRAVGFNSGYGFNSFGVRAVGVNTFGVRAVGVRTGFVGGVRAVGVGGFGGPTVIQQNNRFGLFGGLRSSSTTIIR